MIRPTVVQYNVIEYEPGYFKCVVQYKSFLGFKYWKYITSSGSDSSYVNFQFSLNSCLDIIKKHKNLVHKRVVHTKIL